MQASAWSTSGSMYSSVEVCPVAVFGPSIRNRFGKPDTVMP